MNRYICIYIYIYIDIQLHICIYVHIYIKHLRATIRYDGRCSTHRSLSCYPQASGKKRESYLYTYNTCALIYCIIRYIICAPHNSPCNRASWQIKNYLHIYVCIYMYIYMYMYIYIHIYMYICTFKNMFIYLY